MKKKEIAIVHEQNRIARDIYEMWLTTDLAKEAKPGQFVNVYPKDKSTLLPRPISICEVDKARNRMRIVYRLNGKGTREFSAYRAGDPVSVMGCLGNGYPMDELSKYRNICLMGGGIGIPPMLQLAKELTCEKTLVMGYRNDDLFLNQDLWKYGTLYIATEDGSIGTKGNVLDAVREKAVTMDAICACGPMPMLRAIKQYAGEHHIPAYISLEERMACGVGACLGCVCKTTEVDPHSHVKNARVCTNGPVFLADDVDI